jgi:RpiB/LacA/LacB family sugar-phosphate isomerase
MKIGIGSDEKTSLTKYVMDYVVDRGHQIVLYGPLIGDHSPWPLVSEQLATDVKNGLVDEGILFCYTGTGASIAANKVPGVRAALCGDAQTARGARWWNDANILVMSLRATSENVAGEILEAWFSETLKEEEKPLIQMLNEIEKRNFK